MFLKKIVPALLISIFITSQFLPAQAGAQTPSPDSAEERLAKMSVEERVGQLFIVSFVGDNANPDSDIYQLIRDYHVGGVVLQAANSNFRNDAQTPARIAALTNQLQVAALTSQDLPLFISIDHEGDGWPYSRITGGTTPIPSEMAIGATWDAANAEAVGQVVGQELSAMGINLLFGPVVDVLNAPRPTGRGDIGVRAFGGDPYWVGLMGRAYIRGVHNGSQNRVATVSKHFPGHGGSDRLPDEEVATVDKSLTELKRIELAPFFTITQLFDADPLGFSDGLMSSHIRFRGLQGDIRQFTAPISFDPEGMKALLGLSEFIPWRDKGGLIFSDALGAPAVRKYYDPTLQSFPHRRIAKEAFLAGNDVLVLAQFDLHNAWQTQAANIRDTISFFQEEYRQNHSFAQRVDESVLRILRLKEKLYPSPSAANIQVTPEQALTTCGKATAKMQSIAQAALTLIYPSDYRSYRPPQGTENILIVTDTRQARECYTEACQIIEPLPRDALQNELLRIYGPGAAGMIDPAKINSITFAELKNWLTGQVAPPATPEDVPPDVNVPPEEVAQRIKDAKWLVFVTADLYTSRFPSSDALKLFLSQAQPLLADKEIVVLALSAPYYLDTTEISKLSAFFALYGKTQPQLEIAARALFGEAIPSGASPVNVEGVGYYLTNILSPDPQQSINISVVGNLPVKAMPPLTLKIRAGPINDQNNHPVPDGTTVKFLADYNNGYNVPPVEGQTVDGIGVAEVTITLDKPGKVVIMARCDDAVSSHPIALNLEPPPTATPTITPTPLPSATATVTPTATASPSPTTAPSPSGREDMSGQAKARNVGIWDFLAALAGIAAAFLLSFLVQKERRASPSRCVQMGLLALCGGLAAYLLYGLAGLRPESLWAARPGSGDQRLALAALSFCFSLACSWLRPPLMD